MPKVTAILGLSISKELSGSFVPVSPLFSSKPRVAAKVRVRDLGLSQGAFRTKTSLTSGCSRARDHRLILRLSHVPAEPRVMPVLPQLA